MSTKITTAHAKIIEILDAIFTTGISRIPNPYSLPDNQEHFLESGYGFKINGCDSTIDEFCNYMDTYNCSMIFSRGMIADDGDVTKFDAPVVLLLEDATTFKKRFNKADNLTIGTTIESIVIGSASGISQAQSDKFKFLFIEVPFTFSLRETI